MFAFYTLADSTQISFYQLPKELIKHEIFKGLSDSSKILYALLRDRVSLSLKNNWVDECGHVYIIYTVEEITEDLNCGRDKAIKSMQDLIKIGLVQSIRRGLGKPNLIYVKNFAVPLKKEHENLDFTKKSEKPTSKNPEIRLLEVEKADSTNTYLTNTYTIHTESSQSQSQSQTMEKTDETTTIDKDTTTSELMIGKRETVSTEQNLNDPKQELSENVKVPSLPLTDQSKGINESTHNSYSNYTQSNLTTYKEKIQCNIDYQYFTYPDNMMVDSLVDIMLDVILTESPNTVKIGKETKSREIVKSVYLKLNYEHIQHIIAKYKEQYHEITHKTAYLRTMLYTTHQEIEAWSINQTRADGLVRQSLTCRQPKAGECS